VHGNRARPCKRKIKEHTVERIAQQHAGALVGKKRDKAGRWCLAKIPHYSTDPVNAYAIDERMKQLGRSEQYAKELSTIATGKKIPVEWASPDQRCQAAIKAVRKLSAVKPQ
jgi:hypothetical protein